MKNSVFTLILTLIVFNSFCQDISEKKSITSPKYSENSEIKVILNKNLNKFHSEKKLAGVFVNGIFVGDEHILNVINPDKIESINIEKKDFKKNGRKYSGKFLIKMKSDYIPKFITLNELVTKYLKLDRYPIVFQINENVISLDYNKYLVDENFILKIISNKIITSKKSTKINLIKIITKTPENIKKANVIRIKGTEL